MNKAFLLILTVFLVACQPQGLPSAPAAPSVTVQGPLPTVSILPSLIAPQATPLGALVASTRTYTDPVVGYSIDYPSSWFVQGQPGWVTSLTSFSPEQSGTGGLRPDQAKIDVAPTQPSECGSLKQLVGAIDKEGGETLWEQPWLLAGQIPAIRMERRGEPFGEAAILLTVIHGYCLNVVGYGDRSLFDAIAVSFRSAP